MPYGAGECVMSHCWCVHTMNYDIWNSCNCLHKFRFKPTHEMCLCCLLFVDEQSYDISNTFRGVECFFRSFLSFVMLVSTFHIILFWTVFKFGKPSLCLEPVWTFWIKKKNRRKIVLNTSIRFLGFWLVDKDRIGVSS